MLVHYDNSVTSPIWVLSLSSPLRGSGLGTVGLYETLGVTGCCSWVSTLSPLSFHSVLVCPRFLLHLFSSFVRLSVHVWNATLSNLSLENNLILQLGRCDGVSCELPFSCSSRWWQTSWSAWMGCNIYSGMVLIFFFLHRSPLAASKWSRFHNVFEILAWLFT